jgi:hypothetical protein
MKDDGTLLALGGAALLAAVSATRGRTGSRTAQAHADLRQRMQASVYEPPALQRHYPQTARGQLEPYLGETIYWTNGYGITGPTDGTMVPIEARYLHAISGNIFDYGKLAALVAAIEDGKRPVVRSGYAQLYVLDRDHIRESQEYGVGQDEWGQVYEDSDIGALVGQARDGNHRSFAGLIAGAPVAWVRMSDNDKQELIHGRGDRRVDKLYTAIRKAQKAWGAPLFTRPRKRRVKRTSALDQAEARYKSLDKDVAILERMLLESYYDGKQPGRAQLNSDMLERRPGMYLRMLIKRRRKAEGVAFMDKLFDDPVFQALNATRKQREVLYPKLYELRKQAGLDPRTGDPRYG